MTLTETSPTTGLARPAWLILSLPTIVGYLALAVLIIAQEVESSSAELTQTQISDHGLIVASGVGGAPPNCSSR